MKFAGFIFFSLLIHIALLALMSLKSPQVLSDFTVVEIGTGFQERSGQKKQPEKNRKITPVTQAEETNKEKSQELPSESSTDSENTGSSLVDGNGAAGARVQAPRVLKEAIARYPKAAKMAGVEGVVELQVTINTQGLVQEAQVIRGPGYGLNEAALEAMKNFVFSPASREGERVLAKIIYRYRFILGGS